MERLDQIDHTQFIGRDITQVESFPDRPPQMTRALISSIATDGKSVNAHWVAACLPTVDPNRWVYFYGPKKPNGEVSVFGSTYGISATDLEDGRVELSATHAGVATILPEGDNLDLAQVIKPEVVKRQRRSSKAR